MSAQLEVLPVPGGTAIISLLPALAEVLSGNRNAQLPVPAHDEREISRFTTALQPGKPIDNQVALVVSTSGTTGTPKGAMLSASALRASGTATHNRLGGPGTWLLALPGFHIAGLQVLFRSILAGTEPTVIDVTGGFDPTDLVAAVASMPSGPKYTSLVPTQLIKTLESTEASAALAEFDAVLIGGAALPTKIMESAVAQGISIVRTYGMSETCGGCVYDGIPLDGVDVRIGPNGQVQLRGPMLASGYRGLPDHPAFARPGWFITDDAGTLTNGVLSISGRLDEAISSGGLTIIPQVVEAALSTHPGIIECAVVGLPDPRLGQRAVVAVIPGPQEPTLDELRAHTALTLDSTAWPRELYLLERLPRTSLGKLDRRALAQQLLESATVRRLS